jgi:hypothetical protein
MKAAALKIFLGVMVAFEGNILRMIPMNVSPPLQSMIFDCKVSYSSLLSCVLMLFVPTYQIRKPNPAFLTHFTTPELNTVGRIEESETIAPFKS